MNAIHPTEILNDAIRDAESGDKTRLYSIAANLKELKKALPDFEWISVSKRLPEIGDFITAQYAGLPEYLAFRVSSRMQLDFLRTDGNSWIKLPEPSKIEVQ